MIVFRVVYTGNSSSKVNEERVSVEIFSANLVCNKPGQIFSKGLNSLCCLSPMQLSYNDIYLHNYTHRVIMYIGCKWLKHTANLLVSIFL